jgi:tetratricopeptide (TPR) repeat protein
VRHRFIGLVVGLVCIAGSLTAAAGLQYVREQNYPAPPVSGDALYITSGNGLRRLAVGYTALAADLYWIRAIQYYGGARLRLASVPPMLLSTEASTHFELLYPLLDLTTTLDPRFNMAYRFGSIFLSAPFPTGAGRPDLAVALLEKGLREQPDKWEYLHDIGFVYYWDVHDYAKAAEYFNRAADVPGGPWWMRGMAATTLAKGGQRSASRLLWRSVYENAADESSREAALLKLQQLDALDTLEELQRKIDAFLKQTGRTTVSWEVLAADGVFSGIPLDPSGTPYDLTETGLVTLSQQSRLFPLPVEPAPRTGRS